MILETFKPKPNPKLIANHFNLDRTDNRLINLDWVDGEWNNIHHILMRNKNPNRPHIKAIKDKEQLLFNTIFEAAEYFNIELREFWLTLKEGRQLNGYSLEYLKWNRSEVQKVVKRESSIRTAYGIMTSAPRAIKIMDLYSKEIEEFPTLRAAAIKYNVIIPTLRQQISTKEKPRIFNRRFIISDIDKDFDYLDDKLIKTLLNRGSRPVITFNNRTKEFKYYPSAISFIKENNLMKQRTVITRNLKKE